MAGHPQGTRIQDQKKNVKETVPRKEFLRKTIGLKEERKQDGQDGQEGELLRGGGKGEDIQSLLDDWGYLSDTQKSDRQATLKREHGILALTQFHMKKMIN